MSQPSTRSVRTTIDHYIKRLSAIILPTSTLLTTWFRLNSRRKLRTTTPFSLAVILISLTGTLFLTGCSSNNERPVQRLSEHEYYETAQKAIDSSNYIMAIEQLEQLESRYPFGQYSVQAQLDLIFAYYKSLDYPSAEAHADRFIRLYPEHQNVDYAYYLKGLSVYSIDRGMLARFLPTSPEERDILPAKRALAAFGRLVAKYPNSQYAPDARQRLIYLRNLLADHEILVARFYIKRRAFLAAANRGRYVLENFQGTSAVADGLAVMVEAYRNMELNDLALSAEKNLAANYPDYPGLTDEGHLKVKKLLRNDERSWLNIITFGLLG